MRRTEEIAEEVRQRALEAFVEEIETNYQGKVATIRHLCEVNANQKVAELRREFEAREEEIHRASDVELEDKIKALRFKADYKIKHLEDFIYLPSVVPGARITPEPEFPEGMNIAHSPRSQQISSDIAKYADGTELVPINRQRLDRNFCDWIMKNVGMRQFADVAKPFLKPVNTRAEPDYLKVIKRPMDLSTIQKKLGRGEYENAEAFKEDYDLMLDNCFKYNPEGHEVREHGEALRRHFDTIWATRDNWERDYAKRRGNSQTVAADCSAA